jgi:diguanylate cyclase (GGDEF)-like protein
MPILGKSIISMLVLLVLVVGLPLSTLVTWSIHSHYRSDNTAVKMHAVAITDAIAVRAEITLVETRLVLMEIARRPEVQSMNDQLCDPFIVDLRKTLRNYAKLFLLNKSGEFICSEVNQDTSVVVKTKFPAVYNKMMASDDIELISPIQGPNPKNRIAFAAYPVKDIDKNLLGSVTIPIELSELAPILSSDSLPPGSTIRLVDSKGLILTSYPDNNLIGNYDIAVTEAGIKGQSGSSITVGTDGVERVYAYTRVKGTDWAIFASLPTAWAFANIGFLGNQLLLALCVVLAIAAILGFIVARHIVRPIHILQADAEILATGQYHHRSQVVGKNEVGQLAATFNKLSHSLEKQEKVRKHADLKISQLNRVYAVSSQINALITRVKDLDELFPVACEIAANAGDFRISAIVMVKPNTQEIASIVSAGEDEELLANIKAFLSSPAGMQKSIVSTVIETKAAVISNEINTDSRIIYGKQYASAGINSLIVLPLMVSGEALGIFALYASDSDFFHLNEIQLLIGLASDIAFAIDHIEKQKRVNFLAYYDELTGLANRTLFLERLSSHIDKAKCGGHQLAITLIDLERFKSINDSFGRQAGDALLKQVADWWANKVVNINLLARIDADRFAIIMPLIKSDGNFAKLIENNMADFLEHAFLLDSNVFRISFKAGIALFPDDGANADTLLQNAEAALKYAKKRGEKYLFHTANMTSTVADKLAIENRLREAFDKEEFVLHYQPKVDINSGKVVGAEALIRWNDPQTGLVQPGKFIPILEEIGLINDVGRWVIHKAIADYLRWREAGLDGVRIAVNVSPLQLRNRNFGKEIEQAIAVDSRVAAALELEITENLIMTDVEQSIHILHSIRDMGIPISIDDFGTGFSSLSYLSRLPLDTLKIDRSFIIEMHTQEGRDMVATIIRVAHALKLKVVAEGVEVEEELLQLSKFDCDQIQGFLFSKPVPVNEFTKRFLSPP